MRAAEKPTKTLGEIMAESNGLSIPYHTHFPPILDKRFAGKKLGHETDLGVSWDLAPCNLQHQPGESLGLEL